MIFKSSAQWITLSLCNCWEVLDLSVHVSRLIRSLGFKKKKKEGKKRKKQVCAVGAGVCVLRCGCPQCELVWITSSCNMWFSVVGRKDQVTALFMSFVSFKGKETVSVCSL